MSKDIYDPDYTPDQAALDTVVNAILKHDEQVNSATECATTALAELRADGWKAPYDEVGYGEARALLASFFTQLLAPQAPTIVGCMREALVEARAKKPEK